jgi:N utilization substance protein B
MGKRRDGRLAAVQYLFAHDLHTKAPTDIERAAFWDLHSIKGQARDFAEALINGVLEHRDEIDVQITGLIENYSFERLATVDRNVLRLAAYELTHTPDLPAPVILNEAIEVAKMLGGTESGAFVNGILHKIAQKLRPKSPQPTPFPQTDH